MHNSRLRRSHAVPRLRSPGYPLERLMLVAGVPAGCVAGLFFGSLLSGFAVFVICLCVGFLWRDKEPPVLAFCIAYQWLFVVSGYLYLLQTGSYPSLAFVGDIERAVGLSLIGFLVLTLGIRLAGVLMPEQVKARREELRKQSEPYAIRRVFVAVVVVYSINYLGEISPRLFFFSSAQIFVRLLEFRGVLLFALLATILHRNRGYRYGLAAFLFALVPRFASAQSIFKELFFLLVLALLTLWRPWSQNPGERRRSRVVVTTTVAILLGLGGMGVLWEGAIKPIWRVAYRAGEIEGLPTERVAQFSTAFSQATESFRLSESVEALAARLSSGVGYFSHVLEHVPAVVPHEGGSLCMRAIEHLVTPRFLFPEKEGLGVDSWLVRIYAGLNVAGEELGTSVGLTYMGQFYIDFGSYGMFVPMLVYGLLIGFCHRIFIVVSPSFCIFAGSMVVVFINHFTSYEGEIAKLLGGLVQSFLIFGVFLLVAGPLLHRILQPPEAKTYAAGQRSALRHSTRPPWAPPLASQVGRLSSHVRPFR